jgi:hypothetical protein
MSKENNVSYPYYGVGSYCPQSSDKFANAVAGQILRLVSEYKGGVMDVGGYTPPYNEGDFPDGFLVITLMLEGAPEVKIGIVFGQCDVDSKPAREGFDAHAWLKAPLDPHSGGIYAINFDEAWRIVCIVGMCLSLQKVTLSYGC